jgi:hypothetical protein
MKNDDDVDGFVTRVDMIEQFLLLDMMLIISEQKDK